MVKAELDLISLNQKPCFDFPFRAALKPRANERNIVGCYMLRPFARPVA